MLYWPGRLDGATYARILGVCTALLATATLIGTMRAGGIIPELWPFELSRYMNCSAVIGCPVLGPELKFVPPAAVIAYLAVLLPLMVCRLHNAGVNFQAFIATSDLAASVWRICFAVLVPLAMILEIVARQANYLLVPAILAYLSALAFLQPISPDDGNEQVVSGPDTTARIFVILSGLYMLWTLSAKLGVGLLGADDLRLAMILDASLGAAWQAFLCILPLGFMLIGFAEWKRSGQQGRKTFAAKLLAAAAIVIATISVILTASSIPWLFLGNAAAIQPIYYAESNMILTSLFVIQAKVQLILLALLPLLIAKVLDSPASPEEIPLDSAVRSDATNIQNSQVQKRIFGHRERGK